MRPYEMLTVFSPHLSDEDLTATIDQVTGYVTNGGGAVTQAIKDSPWGRRRLAYTIRHLGQDLRDGFYVLFYFDAEPKAIGDMERLLHLNERVVRHMVLKIDEKAVARQAAVEAKRGQAPRDGRPESRDGREARESREGRPDSREGRPDSREGRDSRPQPREPR